MKNIEIGLIGKDEVILLTFKQKIRLNPGEYFLCVGVAAYEQGEYVVYDRRYDHLLFKVFGPEESVGVFDSETEIEYMVYKSECSNENLNKL